MRKTTVVLAVGFMAAGAFGEMMDRPTGIKIGQRMTLRPYVSLSVTYDSNVNGSHGGSGDRGDTLWTVNPGFTLDYKGENWSLLLNGYYNYHAYTKQENVHRHNQHTYGETLRWNWSNSKGAAKGWSLMLSETFNQISMSDDIAYGDGSSYSADRYQFTINGGAHHKFNELWHAGMNANYYIIDYANETAAVGRPALFGWQRWQATADAGFAPSKWTDLIASIGYQGYVQDNVSGTKIGRESYGYSAHLGVGSYATERITYRALAGWSRFEYGGNDSSDDGFTYSASANWKVSDSLHTMLLATSYYHPSERERSAKSRTDSVSWGLGKSWIRGRLRTTLDLTYRRTTNEIVGNNASIDYTVDAATARLQADYTINRFVAGFIMGEYQRSWNSESERKNGYCDYDRWRTTIGIRLTY